MRAIHKFSLTLSAVAVLLLLAIALTSVGANSRFTQSSAPKPSARAVVAKVMKTYTMNSGLWRTDASFVSTIRIKNVLVVAPLDVTPVLFMADGTPYMLSSVHVPVSGVATVSVNDALASAPQSVAGHVSQFGSVLLMWSYSSPGHLSAQVAAIDASRSLSYTYPFMMPMAMPGHDSKQVLEGLWWKHDSGVTGFVTLSNTTDQQQTASLTAAHLGNLAGSREVSLAPHSTQMLTLDELDVNASASDNHAGGIRVEYQGQQGAILVNGGLANESEGYSANIPFLFHDTSSAPSTTITFASAGLMLGKPDPMMMPGFPKDTSFTPYLALRNTTEKPLDVALQVNYMMGMQGSMPVTKSLPTQHLAPFESRHTDLQGPLSAAGLKNFSGSVNLSASFTGKAGELVLATGSVDQTGTYVFEVEPQGVGSSRSKYANYWGASNGNDTMYSLWNPTDTPQDIAATFYYGDGSGKYVLLVHLDPKASTMIDMAMLIMEKKPDANGNLIPSSIQEGSAEFSSAKDRREMITLVVASGIYNVATATCQQGCITCCGVTEQPGTNPQVTPNPFSCAIGDGVTLGGSAEDCSGQYYSPDTNGWTTSNSSVATVDSIGNVTCIATGSVNISASWSDMVVATGQLCGPPSCPTGSFGATSSVTVVDSTPLITGIDPSDWTAGTTTGVTFTGQYFGTNAPTLSFSPASGISYSLSSYNDTQIVASVTVAAGTPNEQVTVSVTNNGYGGNAFSGASAGESPTSPAVYATVHAPVNSPEITVIAWINGQAPDLATLPGGANQYLVTNLNSSPSTCGREVFLWSVGIPSDLLSSTDQTYANDWLIKYSANPAPPSTITPSAQLSAGNFRMMNDFGKGSGFYQLGITPDPCGTSVPTSILNWIGQGESSQYNGTSGTSPSGKVYQIGEGRVGKIGQAVSDTINNRTVPWIWSVVEFDSSGNPTYSDVGMFPTYSIYTNGTLTVTYSQSSVASFAAKDQTYQRTPSQIQ